MKKIIFCFSAIFISSTLFAQTIVASCKNPEGFGYFHHAGIVSKEDSGFEKDKISGGLTSLVKLPDGKFDIIIVDIRKNIISMTQDGGQIALLRRGSKDATFLHFHPGMVTEIYTFWIDAEGKAKFDILQSKGGDNMPIHKSAVMVGDCSTIHLDLIGN